MTKRVGVLFVHGMGERKRLQHLNECVDDIVAAMRENLGVNVDDRPAMGEAPRRLVVGDTVIECHEVYWADLNEDDTTADQVRFWFWALSMWNARRVIDRSKFIPGAGKMRIPKGVLSPVAHAIARFRLYGVCFIFVPILFVLTVVKFPLKRTRLGNWLGPDTVYTLLRDVKLYEQERWRIPHSPKIRLEEPRVEIRRRMIQKLVEMGLQGYDSWYVFAHSLGSIVAWNGLMETEHSLPNYLDAKIWSQCTQPIPSGPNRGRSLAVTRGNAGPTALMMPTRPKFLTNANAIIDRTRLFNGLEGFFTYGSPLNKFAYLWPAIVPINRDESVFSTGCQWINVFDPLDPVAGALRRSQLTSVRNWQPALTTRQNFTTIEPQDYAYHAHWIMMVNHLAYIRHYPGKSGTLAKYLSSWLLNGGSFPAPKAGSGRWLTTTNALLLLAIRMVQWLVLLTSVIFLSVNMVLLLVELVFYLLNIEMFVTSSKKMDCMSLFRQVNTGVYWYEKPIAVLWSWVKFPVAALWCLDDPKIPFWASVACSAALCFVLGVTRRWYARFL